ncbi:putative glycolipid-binding domain-containing protein [Paracoccus contaminans]|uniref:Uncharacterized protein n=1 Tax=Paracoccus contaminans TaxID=1945662 RepID=A0A1W6CVL1_9RHOB|nr:putative glycolipid-binding domain-containing protein [Paracoccus contaminans]ARJ68886.1 hypothetical protein B0A89_03810 [Paracoccus contaminans]
MADTARAVRWADGEGRGLEHGPLALGPAGPVLEGVVKGARRGDFGRHNGLRANGQGRIRKVRACYTGGADLHVGADEKARWRDETGGQSLPDLGACPDAAIGASPAINALPIRRPGRALREAAEIRVACVPLHSRMGGAFLPRPARQRHARLADRLRRHEGLFRNVTAGLPVDEPDLFPCHPSLLRRA